jgi:hypothetical protein
MLINRRFQDVICQADMLDPFWRERFAAPTVPAVFRLQLQIFH